MAKVHFSSDLYNVLYIDMAELEADGDLVEQAIEGEAIHFLRRSVVASPHFHQEVCWSGGGKRMVKYECFI